MTPAAAQSLVPLSPVPAAGRAAMDAAAEGTGPNYWALVIEHGPGWWPALLLILLCFIAVRHPDLVRDVSEVNFFGVKVTRSVSSLQADAEALNAQVAALETRLAKIETATARGDLREKRFSVQPERRDDATRSPAPALPAVDAPESDAAIAPPMPDVELAERLDAALRHPRYAWRSLDRLALETGAPEPQVRRVLGADRGRFRLGRGVSGRDLARRATR